MYRREASRPGRYAVLMLTLLSSLAFAQVNAENLAAAATQDGLGLLAQAGSNLSVGNLDLLDLRADVAVQHRTSFEAEEGEPVFIKDRLIVSLHGAYRTLSGAPILDERLAHVRYTKMLVPRVGVDLFAQAQNDLVLLLQWRLAAGPGVRLVVVESERLGLWGGTGYLAEHEIRNVSPPDARLVVNHRSTTYLSWRITALPGRLVWLNTGYFQPRLDDPSDIQVLDESALEVTLAQWLSLTTALRLRLDSAPPRPLEPLDLRLTTGLTARLSARRAKPPPG